MVFNLALAAALAWTVNSKSPVAAGGAAPAAEAAKSAPAGTKIKTEVVTNTAFLAGGKAFDWRMVESEDYKKYIANLRSIGCPEETIRDIIIADVNKLFESRKRAQRAASTNQFKFWKAGNPMAAMMDPDRMEKNQALAKEKRALLKELLGIEPEEKPDMMAGMNDMFSTMLDFLPEGKQAQVMDVFMKFQTKIAKSMGNGQPDAEDMKKMQQVQKDMEAELASVMTPKEFEDYQLRMSQTAMVMRMQMAGFNPSEQEFRDIFKQKKAYDDEFGLMGLGTLTKEERNKSAAAKKEMETQLKTTIGDARYAEYERWQDPVFAPMDKAAKRNGLTTDDAVKVYDMKKVAEDQAKKVRIDKSLNQDQRAAALSGIRTETENSMRTVFGPKAYESYTGQPNNTYWLKNIAPDPKPAPTNP